MFMVIGPLCGLLFFSGAAQAKSEMLDDVWPPRR
jgi:hypothetical protein